MSGTCVGTIASVRKEVMARGARVAAARACLRLRGERVERVLGPSHPGTRCDVIVCVVRGQCGASLERVAADLGLSLWR